MTIEIDAIIDNAMLSAQRNGLPVDYVSLSYLVRKTRLNKEYIELYMATRNDIYRKSRLTSQEGQPIYMPNTRFSYMKDLWNTFCYINSVKCGGISDGNV